ncbi:MAG: response regulator transcription factor [Candidatus Shapirobacteria bacterium]|nr:response regulator transcription factor [Candidatus Shapirobacteria bacterium]
MKVKILIIEDDPKIADLVSLYLDKEAFGAITARDGKTGLATFQKEKPSLIVLDLMLPELDGISVLKEIRKIDNTPIIILSSKDEETDKIVGLELGADDYVSKPFSPKELIVRIKTVLRRTADPQPSKQKYHINNLEIDLSRFEVKRDGQLINLTRREFYLLITLARQPGKVFSRSELMDKVYSPDDNVYDRTIDVHVANLRKKLGDERQNLITTISGIGYKLTDNIDAT